jgi:hypothetical protein
MNPHFLHLYTISSPVLPNIVGVTAETVISPSHSGQGTVIFIGSGEDL